MNGFFIISETKFKHYAKVFNSFYIFGGNYNRYFNCPFFFLTITQTTMISPRELRLGNYIFYGGRPFEVTWITNVKFHSYDLKGINLTPELLAKNKFSFVRKSSESLFYDCDFLPNGFDRCVFDLEKSSLSFKFNRGGKELYFLHQIQNLYLLLMGEELPVKL